MKISNIKWKAIIYGFLSYIGMWILWNIVGPYMFPDFQNRVTELLTIVFQLYGLLAALISGYIAARVAGERHTMHGIVAGVVVWLGIIIFWSVFGALKFNTLVSAVFMFVVIVVMSTLGGAVARWRSQNK